MSTAYDVTATMPLAIHRSRRRWRVLALLVACGWLADRFALPALAGRGVRRALASSGYPAARFDVERIGLGHMRLRDVQLAAGVELGEVELDVGLSALWGRRPTTATVRGARVALDAVRLPAGASGSSGGLQRVRLEAAQLVRGRDRAIVSGEIALAGALAADLRATGIRIGGVPVDEAALRIREAGGGYRAAWELHGEGFTARGEGALTAPAGGALALVRGHTEVRAGALAAGGVAITGGVLELDASGPLADLEVRGDARADRVEVAAPGAALQLRDVRAPIAVRARYADGALAVLGRALAATAAEATVSAADREVRVTGIELALDAGAPPATAATAAAATATAGAVTAAGAAAAEERLLLTLGGGAAWQPTVRWSAAAARAGALAAEGLAGSYAAATGAHAIAWRGLTAGARAAGAGSIALRAGGAGLRVEAARLALAGGELTARPAAGDLVVVTARGLSLGRLLPERSVEATALLDGEATVRLGEDGPALVHAELHARGRGTLRVVDPALRDRAGVMAGIEHRIVGALTHFEHTELLAQLGPRGSEPELRLVARGRGASVPQELDLAINFRGAWTALDRLSRSYR